MITKVDLPLGFSPPQMYPTWADCSASSRGRGPRAAGWFAGFLQEKKDESMESLVLEGGIKGWVAKGGEHVRSMEGFEPAVWCQRN